MKLKLTLFFVVLIFNSVAGAFSTMVMPAADRIIRLLIVGRRRHHDRHGAFCGVAPPFLLSVPGI